MIVNMKPTDVPALKYGLEKREKMLTRAVKDSTACGMAMLPQAAEVSLTAATLRVVTEICKRDRGFVGPHEWSDAFRETMKNAASLYLADAGAVSEKLEGLGIGIMLVDKRMEEVRNLHDRLSGKLDLFDDPSYDPDAYVLEARIGERGGVDFRTTQSGGGADDWTTYRDGKPLDGKSAPALSLADLAEKVAAEVDDAKVTVTGPDGRRVTVSGEKLRQAARELRAES